MRHPGRKFPGSLIQGDSLSILVDRAREICEAVKGSGNAELIGVAEELKVALEARLTDYENVLAKHKIELPYTKGT